MNRPKNAVYNEVPEVASRQGLVTEGFGFDPLVTEALGLANAQIDLDLGQQSRLTRPRQAFGVARSALFRGRG